MAISGLEARIGNRIADREMVHHLTLGEGQVEIAVHRIVVECADAGRTYAVRFGGEIQAMADGARFEMHVSITAVAVSASGPFEVADHRECHAGVAGEVLPEAQARGRDALVTVLDALELRMLGP